MIRGDAGHPHRHHDGTGSVYVHPEDLFVLVKDPLAKRPHYFIGHTQTHGPHTSPLRHQAKRMDAVTAHAWAHFLQEAGHSFFLAVHHEAKKKQPMKILSVKGEGGSKFRGW